MAEEWNEVERLCNKCNEYKNSFDILMNQLYLA